MLDASSLATKECLYEIGSPSDTLRAINNYGGLLKKDTLPTSVLKTVNPIGSTEFEDPKVGFLILANQYDAFKAGGCSAESSANVIVEHMPNLKKDLAEIIRLLNESQGRHDFIQNIITPKDVSAKRHLIPSFGVSSIYGNNRYLVKNAERLLKKGSPFAFPFCTKGKPLKNPIKDGPRCPEGRAHVVVISGIQKCCGIFGCRSLFKVQESLGEEWQINHNGGWVDANHLLDYSDHKNDHSKGAQMLWIEPAQNKKNQ